MQELELKSESLVQVSLTLKDVALERIFLRTSGAKLRILLDDREIGEVGTGLLQDIKPGEHGVTLQGVGLFWEGRVRVAEGQTVIVEANPRKVGWISFGTGFVSLTVAAASFVLSYLAHDTYKNSVVSADITKARQDAELWSTVSIAAGGASGGTMTLGGILWLFMPDHQKLEKGIFDLDRKIGELQARGK
jgi:hypothetical protein